MIACILGRQPELSMAELEQQFGSDKTHYFSDEAALVDADDLFVQRYGGVVKAGQIIKEYPAMSWIELSKKIVHHYSHSWKDHEGKLTLGISVYGASPNPRDVQKTGLVLKQILKKDGVNVRLIPNDDVALSTATSHHNKLGLAPNKVELLVMYSDRKVIVAESIGSQNITALAARDQGRPKRDAFVGMLPPKLALLMVNLTGVTHEKDANPLRILDPFCGTGVVLQEAALLGFNVYGTDLSEKMVDYSLANMEWLVKGQNLTTEVTVHHGDAIETQWQAPIDAVVAETYLGLPFSAPPAPEKLAQVRRSCNEIISKSLHNLATQLKPGTPLCIAVPAWRDAQGRFTQLPLISELEVLGYQLQDLKHVDSHDLLYFREDQIVARQLLVLKRR